MAFYNAASDRDVKQVPISDRPKEYTIYVSNLPKELNEDSIRAIFSPYGDITGMFYRPNITWTYIAYRTFHEAELAIRELNNKKPLYLNVTFAKERSNPKQEVQQFNPLIMKNIPNDAIEPSVYYNTKYQPRDIHHDEKQLLDLSCASYVPEASNNYVNNSFVDVNSLWTRGVVMITADGKRYVSLGKCKIYEIPNPNPNVEECIQKVYLSRNNQLYNYSKEKFKDGVQKCILCSIETTKHCEKCHTYYCSKTCQITDWQRHQVECERIPALVEDVSDGTAEDQFVSKSNAIRKFSTYNKVTLRRPNTLQVEASHNIDMRTNTIDSAISTANSTAYKSNQKDYPSIQCDDINAFPSKNTIPSTMNVDIKNQQINDFECFNTHIKENIDQLSDKNNKQSNFQKDMFLSSVNFTKVEVIVPLKNDEYWIWKVEDKAARYNLRIKLQEMLPKNQLQMNHIVINGIYGVTSQGVCNRAMITSVNPLKVHYIDMGTEEVLEYDKIHIIDIQQLIKLPKYARKIRLTQTTNEKHKNLQISDVISVKMLFVDVDGTILVEMQPEVTPKEIFSMQENDFQFVKNVETSTNQLPNILECLADELAQSQKNELKITGIMQVFSCTQKNIYTATLVPENFINSMEEIVTKLPLECTNLNKSNVQYEPKVGDFVCGEMETDVWYRGYVSTLTPKLQIAVIDEGRIVSADKILPCPKEFTSICAFGVTCEVSNFELQINDMYEFTGVMKQHFHNRESLEIKITVGTGLFTAVVKPWKFVPDALKIRHISSCIPKFAELKNGSKVCLTSYRNHYLMFARSLDETEVERYNNLMRDMTKHANACFLTEPPKINDLVIARYCDGNDYRAIITKIHNDKVMIVYIDYGNEEEKNIKELRQAPEKYTEERSCVAKIKLKDVPYNTMINMKVDAYLRDFVRNEIPLTCTFASESLESGVYLTMPTGESVNEKIKQLLLPESKQENNDKICYMIDDIEIASLGRVGETVEALVLYQIDRNKLNYMLGPCNIELIRQITDTMPKLLKEYAEKTKYYIPKMQELCVGLYQNDWYRALCINPNTTKTECTIFFVDYGNVEQVEHKYIRMMPKDFIVPAAMANICKIVNLAPVDSAGNCSTDVKQKITELIQLNTFIKVKIVSCGQSGEYEVELPEIHAALTKEGLVPSSF